MPCSDSPRRGPSPDTAASRPAPASPPAELATASLHLPADAAWSPSSDVVPRPHRDRDAERARSDAIISATAGLLGQGCILAIKGLGGFHLACDATNDEAVTRLRERKNRWDKPLAIMVPTLEQAREICDVNEREEALLTGAVRPIVLLRLRDDADSRIAPSVAGGLREMGVMLPYTPLHHLLLGEVDGPLVMTSGNLSEEPIATGNTEALERLGRIADAFLLHDRDIYSRYDDSVVRIVDDDRRAAPTGARLRPLPPRAAVRKRHRHPRRRAPSRRTPSRS